MREGKKSEGGGLLKSPPPPGSYRVKKIQTAQNGALRIATGCHLMADIDHIHKEAELLTVRQHLGLPSEQYLVKCLDQKRMCHKGSAPKADEAHSTHQTLPQCATVTGRHRRLTHGNPHRGSNQG